MTRPTDAAIARAFWLNREEIDWDSPVDFINEVIRDAEQFDAEAGGTDRQPDEICEPCGYVRGSLGCDDAHKKREKVTTSPQRVQIPAESNYVPPDGKVACPIPTCRADLMPGQTCGGVNCGLRRSE